MITQTLIVIDNSLAFMTTAQIRFLSVTAFNRSIGQPVQKIGACGSLTLEIMIIISLPSIHRSGVLNTNSYIWKPLYAQVPALGRPSVCEPGLLRAAVFDMRQRSYNDQPVRRSSEITEWDVVIRWRFAFITAANIAVLLHWPWCYHRPLETTPLALLTVTASQFLYISRIEFRYPVFGCATLY